MIRSKNITQFPIHWIAFDEILRISKREDRVSYIGDINPIFEPMYNKHSYPFNIQSAKFGYFNVAIIDDFIRVDYSCRRFGNIYPEITFSFFQDIVYIGKYFSDKNAEILYDIDGIISELNDEMVCFKSLLNGIDAEKIFITNYGELIQDIMMNIDKRTNVKMEFFADQFGWDR